LDSRKCYTAGTVIAGRVGSPEPVKQGAMKKMKSGGTCAYRDGSVLIMGWEDKMVLMMSSYHDTSVEKVVTVQKGSSRKKFKSPCVFLLYNTYECCRLQRSLMHITAPHMLSFRNLQKAGEKSFLCLEVCIVNSYILYCNLKAKIGAKPVSLVRYQ
jgi:hypothetical protein